MSTNLISEALLRAQRSSWRPPRPVRRAAKYVLRRNVRTELAVEPWTTPLLGDGVLGEPPTRLRPPRAAVPPPARPAATAAPLRCLLVTDTMDVGGSEEVVAFLARHLPAHGIEPTVVYTRLADASAPRPRLAAGLAAAGVRVLDVSEGGARRLLAEQRPDVISAHGPPAWWIDVADAAGIPYIETLHGMHSFFGIDWPAEARRSRRVAKFIAVSELVRRQYLAGNPGAGEARVVTVPNSVDDHRMPRLDRGECRRWLGLDDEFLFVSLARFSMQKNTYALVRAFDAVAAVHPKAHLLVAGRPDRHGFPHQVRRLRDGLAARDRIHLRDHAPWPAAPLAAADAFVLNSYFEGWSLASMEALYAGLPVVLSDVGGAREQVGSNGERGRLVGNPLGDPLAVDWETIGESLYSPQANHDELVAAMCAVVEERDHWHARRDELEHESAARFHPDHALMGHAAAIRSVV